MKLNDLIEALASEVELAQPRLARCLEVLAVRDAEDSDFADAMDEYAGQAQRMGEAAEMAGFPGLQAVCAHVLDNMLALPALPVEDRGALLEFLRGWPPLIVFYLRNVADPTTAAGLVDHLVRAPYALEEEQALKVMHMLGAMPLQVQLPGQGDGPLRPVLATPQDVDLSPPVDADPKLMEGFLQEAPEQARYLVQLVRSMTSGLGDSSDLVAAKRVAHTLKGSGAILGLRGLASLGHHFEDILEHFETHGGQVAAAALDALLDAAYCMEQMVGYVAGVEEPPAQALAVLQTVLDLANRIDRGESLDEPISRVAPFAAAAILPQAVPAASTDAPMVNTPESSVSAAQPRAGNTPAGPSPTPAAALRVSVQRVEELFRVSGEVSVHSAAMEARLHALAERSRELLQQNLRVQKRLFELETAVDVRALGVARGSGDAAGFDPLEMDRYSELHSVAHALIEEASDARAMALRLEEEVAQVGAVQTRQQRLSKELQHLVIGTRMTEVGVLESRLQRNVRSTCQATGKQAELIVTGGDTLIDSDILNRLADPLLHLLRNAVDHGLEMPATRVSNGKHATGRIVLEFSRQGQQVVMRCRDDGAGLDLGAIRRRAIERGLVSADQTLTDEETARLILLAGFSTRDAVNEVSGRGIGLDVVRDWASATNGSIRIQTERGRGCTFELRFAASLSTMHSLVVEAAGQRFALPSLQVEQAVPRGEGRFESIGSELGFRHHDRVLPTIRLADAAGLAHAASVAIDEHDIVVVRHNDTLRAIAVEKLVDSRELLVKNPGRYVRHLRGVAGLSILGDGSVAVNIDLSQLLAHGRHDWRRSVQGVTRPAPAAATSRRERGVLIVDDSLTVRNSLVRLVEDAGFRTEVARDGVDAIDSMRAFRPDLVLTDLEMPNMNGIELTTHIRGRADLSGLPVIMITSRSQEKHRQLARQAGVDTYLTKPFNDAELLQTIRSALTA